MLSDSDVFAGTERHALELAAGLHERGVAVSVGCPAGSPLAVKAAALGVTAIAIEKRGAYDRQAIKTLTDLLRSGEVDLLHAHNGRMAWLGALARRRAKRGSLLSTMHFIEPSRSGRTGLKKVVGDALHRFVRRQSAGLIAISDAVRDRAVAREDHDADRIWKVYNGVSKPATTRSREQVRSELGVDTATPLLVSAVRLEKEKSVEVLIDAAERLLTSASASSDASPFRWVVAGDGSMQAALQDRLDRSGLGVCVSLLGFREDVHELMAAGDVLVHPAVAEPFGLVLAEAMALGRAVIASDGGAAPEIVVPNQTGWLFRAQDAESLAQTIGEALSDRERLTRCGEAGARRYAERFTAEHMVEGTLAVYRRVLGQSLPQSGTNHES